MRKYALATLSCVLLLPGATVFAIETSLLDRLAQENIIGDGKASPQALPIPAPAVSSRPAEPKIEPIKAAQVSTDSAQLANQLREVSERVMALQQRLSAIETSRASPPRQQAQGKNVLQRPSASAKPARTEDRDLARIRDLSKQLAAAMKQRDALAAEVSNIKAATDKNKSDGAALAAAGTEIANLKKQVTELQALNQRLSNKPKTDSAALSTDLNAARTEISSLKKQLIELQATNQGLAKKSTSDSDALKVELSAAKAEIASLKKRSAELQADIQERISKTDSGAHKTDLNTATTEIAGLKKQVTELQTANQQLLNKSKFDSDELGADLSAARSEVTALKKQVAELQTSNRSYTDKSKSDGASLSAELSAARSELANLKKRMEELQVDNRQLAEKAKFDSGALNADLKEARTEIANLKKQAGDLQTGKRVIVNDAASKDVRTSYAVGVWYADTAAKETQKLAAIGRKLDAQAFSAGFNDKINNRLQLSEAKLAAEINDTQKQLQAGMQSTEKKSKVLMDTAAKQKGAVKMPDGVVYQIIDKGKAPTVTDKQDIVFDINEQLSSGEELNRETQTKRVGELSPLFQTIFRQLGVGGSAKIYTPITQAHTDAMGLPSGAVSIITIKVSDIK